KRELLPLAEADLGTFGPCRAELGVKAGGQPGDDVRGTCALDSGLHGGVVVDAWEGSEADGLPCAELETEEILKSAGEPGPPAFNRHPRQVSSIDQDATFRRQIHPAEQLHECRLACAVLADDGHDRPWLQVEAHILEHALLRSRVTERHM